MSTVVDDLLQDFESDDEAQDTPLNDQDDNVADADVDEAMGGVVDGEEQDQQDANSMKDRDEQDDAEATKARIEKLQLIGVKDKVARYKSRPSEADSIGNVEDHPEYVLLTQANGLSTQIDSEIVLVHKFIRDHYSVRFPELETLISNPLEYAKVVAIIGNGPMDSASITTLQSSADNPLGVTLRSILDGPSLMVVTVEATTSQGREMTPEELQRVLGACEMVLSLDRAKQTLTEFVQSRMNVFSPNLTALIGSLTAAQLLNAAGGLTGLSKTPACNIAAWGSRRQKNTALATNDGIRQQGYLYHSELMRGIPNDLKRQAMRIVSAKLVLAARVDRVHTSARGQMGRELREQCLERLEKLTAPPPNKGARALPAPDDKPSRKRGGRRARKAKEATAMTELRKSQNRMAFGKEEKEVGLGLGSGTVGLGMIGQPQDGGRIRSLQVDQRTRAKLSAKSKGWGAASSIGGASSSIRAMANSALPEFGGGGGRGLRSTGVGSTIGAAAGAGAGTASSLAFGASDGLKLVASTDHLKRKRKADEDKWFQGGTFTQIGGGGGTVDQDGFKVPMLPPSKKANTG